MLDTTLAEDSGDGISSDGVSAVGLSPCTLTKECPSEAGRVFVVRSLSGWTGYGRHFRGVQNYSNKTTKIKARINPHILFLECVI
jgi:hypothetical protein